jgi:hypothetical protein
MVMSSEMSSDFQLKLNHLLPLTVSTSHHKLIDTVDIAQILKQAPILSPLSDGPMVLTARCTGYIISARKYRATVKDHVIIFNPFA